MTLIEIPLTDRDEHVCFKTCQRSAFSEHSDSPVGFLQWKSLVNVIHTKFAVTVDETLLGQDIVCFEYRQDDRHRFCSVVCLPSRRDSADVEIGSVGKPDSTSSDLSSLTQGHRPISVNMEFSYHLTQVAD